MSVCGEEGWHAPRFDGSGDPPGALIRALRVLHRPRRAFCRVAADTAVYEDRPHVLVVGLSRGADRQEEDGAEGDEESR